MKKSRYLLNVTLLACIVFLSIPFQVHAALQVIACFESNSNKILSATQGDIFPLEITKVLPQQTTNQDCLLINSISYDASQTLNIGSQIAGVGAGKITFDPLTISKNVDFLSPYLFVRMASGESFRSVNIFFYEQIPQAAQITAKPVMLVQLGLAAIKTISVSATTGDEGLNNNETVAMEYGEIKTTVYRYDTAGRRTEIAQGWSRILNKPVISDEFITALKLPL